MNFLILVVLSAVGVCEAVHWQKLTCPYSDPQQESLPRVWCRQTSDECCTGLSFNQSAHSVHGGRVRVTQGSDFFTVAVLKPGHGGGVHWCGVLSEEDTIIKLAEGYFHNSSWGFIWSFTRWILLPLLPMTIIFTSVYFRFKSFCCVTTRDSQDRYKYDAVQTGAPLGGSGGMAPPIHLLAPPLCGVLT